MIYKIYEFELDGEFILREYSNLDFLDLIKISKYSNEKDHSSKDEKVSYIFVREDNTYGYHYYNINAITNDDIIIME